jgi:hypothetical protein
MHPLAKTTLGFGAVAVLFALFYGLAPHYSTILFWDLRAGLFWLLPLAGLAVVLLIGATWAALANERGRGAGVGVFSVVVGLGALVAVSWWIVSTHGYLQDRDYYTASAVTEHGAAPTLGQRAPYSVAESQARPNLGDVSGEVEGTAYLPETGHYSTLVKRRGSLSAGYQVVLDQDVPLAGGRGEGTTCQFASKAALRDGGWWSHNLARAINDRKRGVTYDSGDLYAYCDGQTPMVVAPLKRQTGWLVVTERPAGVALYNGRTATLTIRATAAGIPGPAYPLSLAATQREALKASGGYWDYRGGRSGFEASADDVNSGNTTEFVLPLIAAKNRAGYATMLTGRGSATAISAVSVVDGRPRSGKLAPIDVYRTSPEWVSPDAIESRIKADYQDLPNWQNQKVLEVSPLDGGHWAATIGNGQNVLYRVRGVGSLRGANATCLYRADGTQVRCGTAADTDGNSVGTNYASADGSTSPTGLTKLTNKQLATLERQVAAEVARRLEAGK